VLFISIFERGDDEKKITTEKNRIKITFSIRISIVLFDFASQLLYKNYNKNNGAYNVCKRKLGCKTPSSQRYPPQQCGKQHRELT